MSATAIWSCIYVYVYTTVQVLRTEYLTRADFGQSNGVSVTSHQLRVTRFTTAMDESSYADALDAITFDEHTTCIHYYDSNQEREGVWDP